MAKYEVIFYERKNGDVPVQDFLMGLDTLSEQGDTRFCTTDLGFCRVTVAQRTSSTPRSSALQNPKSEAQNSFGPQVPYFGGWQGNGMRRTGRTPIDVNVASRQKTVLGASVPLFTEGKKMRAKLSAIISILQQYGNQLREPYSKYLDDGIFEIRGKIGSDISRVLYFFYCDGKIILTNGFIKKTQKTPKAELEKAKQYRKDYLERMKGNENI